MTIEKQPRAVADIDKEIEETRASLHAASRRLTNLKVERAWAIAGKVKPE